VHWAKKAKAAKEYRKACMWGFAPLRPWVGKKKFSFQFQPPSARRADLDNMFAQMKPAIDALAIVSGVDDSEFQFTISKAPPVKGGAVRVEAI
jgi:crossover junction endodeoxyribonuclease RusA